MAALAPHAVTLVLDNVRSAENVGTIFRSADAARAAEVLTCGFTPTPPHAKLDKTAFGALASVPCRHFDSTLAAVAELQARCHAACAISRARSIACWWLDAAALRQDRLRRDHPPPPPREKEKNTRSVTARALQARGVRVIALETVDGALPLASAACVLPEPTEAAAGGDGGGVGGAASERARAPQGGVALVLGNEVTGVDAKVRTADRAIAARRRTRADACVVCVGGGVSLRPLVRVAE